MTWKSRRHLQSYSPYVECLNILGVNPGIRNSAAFAVRGSPGMLSVSTWLDQLMPQVFALRIPEHVKRSRLQRERTAWPHRTRRAHWPALLVSSDKRHDKHYLSFDNLCHDVSSALAWTLDECLCAPPIDIGLRVLCLLLLHAPPAEKQCTGNTASVH